MRSCLGMGLARHAERSADQIDRNFRPKHVTPARTGTAKGALRAIDHSTVWHGLVAVLDAAYLNAPPAQKTPTGLPVAPAYAASFHGLIFASVLASVDLATAVS
jgi:hypothetical protein